MAEKSFDSRVERFLKGLMSPEEEGEFKQELHLDKDKLRRAQAIALAIKEMKNQSKDSDEKIISEVQTMSKSDLDRLATGAATEDFDYRVEQYLKGLMSPEEESEFKEELASSEELRERAQIIAMAIQGISKETKRNDQLMIDAIRSTKMNDLKRLIGINVVPWFKYMSIAASVLIILGIGSTFTIRQQQINNLYETVDNLHLEVGDLSRSHGESLDEREIADARLVDSLLVVLEIGGTEETVRLLNLKKGVYGDDSAIIDWKIAVYYIKKNKSDEARSYLYKIIKEHNDEPIAAKAKSVLKQMDSIWFY